MDIQTARALASAETPSPSYVYQQASLVVLVALLDAVERLAANANQLPTPKRARRRKRPAGAMDGARG